MKFKIYHKEFERYLPSDEWFVNGDGEVFFYDMMDGELVKCDPKIVEIRRFTEMYDVNEDPIYESDMVRFSLPSVHNMHSTYEINYRFGGWQVGDNYNLNELWSDNTEVGDVCGLILIK